VIVRQTLRVSDGHGNTRGLLQAATEQAHRRLNAHQGLGALAARMLDTEGYVKLLLDLLPIHRLVEQRLSPFNETACFGWHTSFSCTKRSDRLRADLQYLGAPPAVVPELGHLLRPFEMRAAALGCAWVVEGSALGARVLSRSLADSLGIGPATGGAFFAPQPHEQERWLACWAAEETCGQHPEQRGFIVASAQATFGAFLHSMNRTA
jgi:heme oxygenase (biliverdin-IX-beta and delta-forming)